MRRQSQRFAGAGERILEGAESVFHVRLIRVRVGVLRINRKRIAQQRARRCKVFALRGDNAQRMKRVDLIRVLRDHVPIEALGFIEIFRAMPHPLHAAMRPPCRRDLATYSPSLMMNGGKQ